MPRKLLVYILILSVPLVVVLVLFPPWYTLISGNGHPLIDFQWIGHPPSPINGLNYQVDMDRLVKRIAVAILSLVVTVYGVIKIAQLRRDK